MNCIQILYLMACLGSIDIDIDLDDLRKAVSNNFSQIKTLRIESNMSLGAHPPSEMLVINFYIHDFEKNAIRRDQMIYHPSEDRYSFKQSHAYNGMEGRALSWDDPASDLPSMGTILSDDEIKSRLMIDPSASVGALRGFGYNIDGRSIQEWLLHKNAVLLGVEVVDNERCVVVFLDDNLQYKFYFSIDKNFTLKQYESFRDGVLTFTVKNLEFHRAGEVFFPIKGKLIAHYMSGENMYNVNSIAINEPISMEEFDITFTEGMLVLDEQAKLFLTWGDESATKTFEEHYASLNLESDLSETIENDSRYTILGYILVFSAIVLLLIYLLLFYKRKTA